MKKIEDLKKKVREYLMKKYGAYLRSRQSEATIFIIEKKLNEIIDEINKIEKRLNKIPKEVNRLRVYRSPK